jgi:DNA invertase Pin-like site-specific DNA recombinase
LNIEFIGFREQIDTGGPPGRAVVVIIGAIAELERSLIVERVRVGMRRAKLEGQHIGRKPLDLDIFRPWLTVAPKHLTTVQEELRLRSQPDN